MPAPNDGTGTYTSTTDVNCFQASQRRQAAVLLFVIANCYIAAAVHIKYDRKLGAPVTINTIYDTETRSVRKVMSQT